MLTEQICTRFPFALRVSTSRSSCCFQSTRRASSYKIFVLLRFSYTSSKEVQKKQTKLSTCGNCMVILFGKSFDSSFIVFGISLPLSCNLPKLSCEKVKCRSRVGSTKKHPTRTNRIRAAHNFNACLTQAGNDAQPGILG